MVVSIWACMVKVPRKDRNIEGKTSPPPPLFFNFLKRRRGGLVVGKQYTGKHQEKSLRIKDVQFRDDFNILKENIFFSFFKNK